MPEPILDLHDVYAGYQKAEILHGVSLNIYPGEMVCVIGPNGAGKTTLLNSIFGVARVSSGEILLEKTNLCTIPRHERIKRGISLIPQEKNVFASLSVLENLEMGFTANRSGNMRETMEKVFRQFPRLEERQKQRAGTLSGGERRMLAVGIGLMSNPRVLLLDEPSLGLAPIVVTQLFERIREINCQGTTILLVEQNARKALGVAHRGYVLELGQIKLQGSGADLANDPEVQRLYMGGVGVPTSVETDACPQ